MATPGIGDPYWFEWYVGLKNIINMLNPDNGIEYVIFQCSKYNTIDDVVVGYKDGGHEICYQIKHEIFTSKTQNLTFGKLLEQETKTKPCLLCAIAQGWQAARASAENQIKPILYTNRTLGPNRATRTFNGKSYSSYPIKKFFEKVKTALNKLPEGAEVSFEDKTLQTQWEEMCAAIDTLDTATIVAFSKAFEIQGNQLGLLDTEHELITSLAKTFACSDNLAKELFIKLAAALRKWTTTSRANEKIFIEDVYSILGAESEPDLSPHRLAPPFPFFESRKAFSARLEKQARYEEIAGFLADYLLHHNEGLLTYILTIPLLCHANKKELIPQYFTSSFVIDRFLLFILLKSNIGLKLLKTYDLAADLEYTLMNIDLLGMHYKVHILEFLKTHNRLPKITKSF